MRVSKQRVETISGMTRLLPVEKRFRESTSLTLMAASITVRISDIEEKIGQTTEQLEKDSGASPSLKAELEALHRKTRDACNALRGADEETIREQIIEVEHAADSAKRVAEADPSLASDTRDAVLSVHGALSEIKGEVVR